MLHGGCTCPASARQQARTRVRASDISEARPVLLAVRHRPTRSIDSDVRTGLVRILALCASATNPPSLHESRSCGRPSPKVLDDRDWPEARQHCGVRAGGPGRRNSHGMVTRAAGTTTPTHLLTSPTLRARANCVLGARVSNTPPMCCCHPLRNSCRSLLR
jgi:hypothetical protein